MHSEIRVRPFVRDDQEIVVNLYEIGLTWYTEENSTRELASVTRQLAEARCFSPEGDMYDIEKTYLKGNDSRKNFFVAVDVTNGINRVVGCVGAIPSTEFDPNEYIELVRMSVDPEYHGKGVSGALMTAFENWARVNNYRKVNLTTLDGMKPAVRFYTKNGFELFHEKEQRLDLSKYGTMFQNENANAVNLIHFVKFL